MRCPLQGKRFYSREWVFSKLSAYLEKQHSQATNGVLITGHAGSGKTALCCELVWPTVVISPQAELNSRLVAHHFCQRFDADTLEPASLIFALAQQLSQSDLLPQYAEFYNNDPSIKIWLEPANCRRFPKQALRHVILEPLQCMPAPEETLFLIIDSLHETVDNGGAADNVDFLDLILEASSMLPRWLLLLCTSRKGCKPVTQYLAGFRKITIDDLRRSCVVRDVQQYILSRLDTEEALKRQLDLETAEMLNQLHIKSAGCFLYLEQVLDGVCTGFIRLREVQHMPCTLNGLYLWLCQRLFVRGQGFSRARLVLDVLLATRQPLNLEQIFEIVASRRRKLDGKDFVCLLDSFQQVLLEIYPETHPQRQTRDSNVILIFHPSFAEWLLDVKYCTRKYLCDRSEGHGALALWYASRGKSLKPEEIVHFAYHLTKSTQFKDTLLPVILLQSKAPVQELILNYPVINEPTTRLLLETGADFVNIGENLCLNDVQQQSLYETDKDSPTLDSESSENEVLVDESYVDSEGRTALHQLAKCGRQSAVKKLLKGGAYCDPEDKVGDTPLCMAARQGHCLVVEHLLNAGADPNHFGSEGWTPLRCAAWGGHIETAQTLLNRGALVDLVNVDKRSALRAAAWGGHEELVACLLKAGAQVNLADGEGRSALMAAAYMGHRDIVEQLLTAGANPNCADCDGRTALGVTAVCASPNANHLGVAEALLLGGTNVDCQDNAGRTPLFCAALEGHVAMCKLLLSFGADVDHCDFSQNTPLLAAASTGQVLTLNVLLGYGAVVDTIDCEGRTVLSLGAAHGNVELISALLDVGLDEMHRDNYGWLPLHLAAIEGHVDACRLLCQRNSATVHECDHDGRHPIILAGEEGHEETARLLLDYGANVNQPTIDGRTVLRLAAMAGHTRLCQLLVARGADMESRDLDGRSILYSLVLNKQTEMAECLLSFGARVNHPDFQGRTPLHASSWQGDLVSTDLLLKYGADINATDIEDRTPLMLALWRGHSEIVRLLVSRRADLNVACIEGASALSVAAQEGKLMEVKLLLDYGANPFHCDKYGRTPLEVAAKASHHDIVALLKQQALQSPTKKRSTLSPTLNGSTITNSGGSLQTSAEHTSGFVSFSGSPFATVDSHANFLDRDHFGKDDESAPPGLISKTMTSQCSGKSANYSSSTKSTLSSCDSPEDDFARKLLERSLPRPHSRPLSMKLTAVEISAIAEATPEPETMETAPRSNSETIEMAPRSKSDICDSPLLDGEGFANRSRSSRFRSVPSNRRRRPGIATNPKYRKPREANGATFGSRVDRQVISDRDLLRTTAAKLQSLVLQTDHETDV